MISSLNETRTSTFPHEDAMVTHLKPVKEYKKLDCSIPLQDLYEENLDYLGEKLEEFKNKIDEFKEEGWEGVTVFYQGGFPRPHLYKTHLVEDEEYDRAITVALQNKPNWEDLGEEVKSIGIVLWECDYQYQWADFYHEDPSNCVFVENRPENQEKGATDAC